MRNPGWLRATPVKYASKRPEPVYTRAQFERAPTHDALRNAAQNQARTRGIIHGYYRMCWAKQPLPREASMIHPHHRDAVDGRAPNTHTDIRRDLGLQDRPCCRSPICRVTRYSTLDGMKRKTGGDASIREVTQGRPL